MDGKAPAVGHTKPARAPLVRNPLALLRMLAAKSREVGPAFLALRILHLITPDFLFSANALVVVVSKIPASAASAKPDPELRWADRHDVRRLHKVSHGGDDWRDRLERGGEGAVLERDNQVVAFEWFHATAPDRDEPWSVPLLGKGSWLSLRLPPEDIWSAESWVAPEHRGQRLIVRCQKFANTRFARARYRRYWGMMYVGNTNAFRAHAKRGYHPVGRIFYIRVLGLTFVRAGGFAGLGWWTGKRPFELRVRKDDARPGRTAVTGAAGRGDGLSTRAPTNDTRVSIHYEPRSAAGSSTPTRAPRVAAGKAPGHCGLGQFWRERNASDPVLLDQYSVNNVSFFVAYLSSLLRVTPNQLSVLSAVFSVCAFAAALFLPPGELAMPILLIYALSQFAYLLDCADGQLARATNQTSEFGAFLDKGVDVASRFLAFGGAFAFLYRHALAAGDLATAHASLLVGFLFLLAGAARFLAWQKFVHMYGGRESRTRKSPGLAQRLVVSLMDHQLSLAGILLFLVSPFAGFLLFGVQTIILAAVYVRYFVRARRIDPA